MIQKIQQIILHLQLLQAYIIIIFQTIKQLLC